MLGLSSEEFWSLTLEEFDARYERWEEQEKRWDLRFGVVVATYVNSKLPKGHAPAQPGSFFGHYEPAEEMSDESMLAMMQSFSRSHNQEIAE